MHVSTRGFLWLLPCINLFPTTKTDEGKIFSSNSDANRQPHYSVLPVARCLKVTYTVSVLYQVYPRYISWTTRAVSLKTLSVPQGLADLCNCVKYDHIQISLCWSHVLSSNDNVWSFILYHLDTGFMIKLFNMKRGVQYDYEACCSIWSMAFNTIIKSALSAQSSIIYQYKLSYFLWKYLGTMDRVLKPYFSFH